MAYKCAILQLPGLVILTCDIISMDKARPKQIFIGKGLSVSTR